MTSQTTENQQSQQQQSQQPQQSQQQPQSQWHDQPDFNTTFLSQISGGAAPFPTQVDWAREYFDAIDLQLRSARRVAEYSALSQITHQIVAQCVQLVRQDVQKVVTDLRREYSLMQMQQPQQQSGGSTGTTTSDDSSSSRSGK